MALAAMMATAAAGAQDSGPGGQDALGFARAAHLRRGINLSMWYAQSRDYSAARLARFTTAADFKLVHDLGFDNVRLSIDPVPLIAGSQSAAQTQGQTAEQVLQAAMQPVMLDPDAMARLDASVAQITAQGLVVVLDIHPSEDWKKNATNTDVGTAQFLLFWKAFARHFAGTDPEKVYFEVLNEPEGVNGYQWAGEQAKAVALIRAQAPHHTIIATGESWGGIDGLRQLEPVRQDNVIYSFHDYEPMQFTHQGATWSSNDLPELRGVPYPSTPENVAPLLPGLTDETTRKDLAWYGQQRWGQSTMATRIGLAVAWAAQRHVPLWCGEFGVYRAYSPEADRERWLSDMRQTLEKEGVGWDMWDYQGSFGLVTKQGGTTTVDQGIVRALGLTMATQ
jgi:aryl-phospho-beta-D-glucosidase BglC (GH1 family)